ncbi:MAG TPA: hypothetical protein VN040_14480 [Pseudosphingobacterium sp.]|nr:hypothetical protein [Pseudosphingobacterium sp.]
MAQNYKNIYTTRQSHTIANSTALQAVLNAAIKAQKDSLSIEDVLILALEAGAKFGGDKRCGDTKALSACLKRDWSAPMGLGAINLNLMGIRLL